MQTWKSTGNEQYHNPAFSDTPGGTDGSGVSSFGRQSANHAWERSSDVLEQEKRWIF